VQRQQGLALERQHGLAQVLEPQVLVLVLALKQLMVLQALVLVQLRAARALALATNASHAGSGDFTLPFRIST